jgi:hypothetical protein
VLKPRRRTRSIAIAASENGGWISRNPRECVGLLFGAVAVVWIAVNALFLQKGPHPSPIFSSRHVVTPAAMSRAVVPAAIPAAIPQPARFVPVPVAAPLRNDPIAELIAPPKQVAAIQRALSDFGYGQIRPDGVLGADTRVAIEKFERQHKMPVTGQVSERLVKALSTMTGETPR